MAAIAKVFLDGADQSAKFDVVSVGASEQLGRPYQFSFVVSTERGDLAPSAVLGKTIGVALALQDNVVRRFNGVIVRMGREPQRGKRHQYWFEVQPDFALLSRRSDARVFQNKTVIEVFEQVVARIPSLAWQCSGSSLSHAAWENCVQYQESDVAFAMRLLEQEGIYFYFEQLDGGATRMRLLDDNATSYQVSRPVHRLAFNPTALASARAYDYLESWARVTNMVSGKAELSDFDFTKPMQAQQVRRETPSGHTWDNLDLFLYPGEFDSPQEGETYAELRMEALRAQHAVCEGSTTSPRVEIGKIIQIKDHPIASMNGDFLVISTSYTFINHALQAGSGAGADIRCDFSAIPADIQFRPERLTPKSTILGPQTAFVVGPEKNEIHTDKYGRIRVQFHWDRYGKPTEDTSCWIRTAQPWANQGFGFWALPRVGSEVVVQFLDGDPDRPIVVGSVYNGENQIPYPQPAHKTRSGIRTFSTPEGGVNDYNELRFEDKKGSEEIYLQAQKDLNTRVKADATRTVGGDDRVAVEKSQTIKVAADRTVAVVKDQKTSVQGDRHITTAGNEYRITDGDRVANVGSDSLQVNGDAVCETEGSLGVRVGQSYALNAQMGIALAAQSAVDVKSGMTLALNAQTGLTISCGPSFISLTPAGIFIQGPLVAVQSGGAPLAAKAANPATPRAAQKAADAGAISIAESPPVKPATQQRQAGSLVDAARSGSAFAEAG